MKKPVTKISQSIAALLIIFCVFSSSAYSQSVWVEEPDGEATIGLEALIPSLDIANGDDPIFAAYLYSHIPISEQFTLQFDLPISYLNGVGDGIGIGNPYVGLQYGSVNSGIKVDLGLRLPLASDNGTSLAGFISDTYKVTPFVPDVFGIISNIHYRYEAESGLILRLGGGPELVVPDEGDEDLFVKYYGQLLYGVNDFTFGAGITGRVITTLQGLSFSERANHNLGITGSHDFDKATLGAHLYFPVDDSFTGIEDLVDYVFAVNVTFPL